MMLQCTFKLQVCNIANKYTKPFLETIVLNIMCT